MKFETIMREAGVCTRHFLHLCEIKVVLYDEDDYISEEDDVKFVRPLFEDNPNSFDKFFSFMETLEDYLSVNIQITESHVTVHYKTPQAVVFPRSQPMDPIDYMD